MLDLIPAPDIGQIVNEFLRVLRPGGRIVLANLTEGEGDDVAFSDDWKARYLKDPVRLGGCRPVLATAFLKAAGFTDVQRTYCGGSESWPTEVVTARAPGTATKGTMHQDLMEILVCPLCKGDLQVTIAKEEDARIVDGTLSCAGCKETYPIEAGIPNLLPPDLRD